MEPTNQSSLSDVYYVDKNNKPVEVYHVDETEIEQDEKSQQQSINRDDLPQTADLSEREGKTQLFIINRNKNRQQPSPFKQNLRPSPVPGTYVRDPRPHG